MNSQVLREVTPWVTIWVVGANVDFCLEMPRVFEEFYIHSPPIWEGFIEHYSRPLSEAKTRVLPESESCKSSFDASPGRRR